MRLLDTEIDIGATKHLLLKKHWVLFIILLGTAVLDAVSTTHFMQQTGPGSEMNLVVRILSVWCGVVVGPIIGKLCQLCAMWCISVIVPRLTRFVCIVLIAVNLYAVFFNFQT